VLAHRAGVPTLPAGMLDLDRAGDREFIVRSLCEAKPFAKPGTLLSYHALSGGFILGEIVERVTGKSIRAVIADDILGPLGFRWGNYGVAPEDVDLVGLAYATGPKLVPPLSTLVRRALAAPIDEAVTITNDPRFLTSVMPAASIITTADELGRFFEIFRCGGELDGVRVMSPDTLRRALKTRARLELDLTLGFPVPLQLRADARRAAAQPVRPRHRPGVRPPGADQHRRLGRSRARHLSRADHQRQGDRLPRAAALLRADAVDRRLGAAGAGGRAAVRLTFVSRDAERPVRLTRPTF
jgi:CubicO group peptidase (beta-lactamase class C family)